MIHDSGQLKEKIKQLTKGDSLRLQVYPRNFFV